MVAPMTDITLSIQMTRKQAEAYLTFMVSQYEQAMAACWYADQYRYTHDPIRARRVFDDHPHIAGMGRTIRELRKELREGLEIKF